MNRNNTEQLLPDRPELRFMRADQFRPPQLPIISGDISPEHKKMILSVCSRPEILPCARSIEFKITKDMNVPFRVPSADQIDLNPAILSHISTASLFLRHAIEIAVWQSKMNGHVPLSYFLSIAVLSANAAKSYWESMIEREQYLCLTHMPAEFRPVFDLIKGFDLENCLGSRGKEKMHPVIKELLKLQDMDNVWDSALTEEVFNDVLRFVERGAFIAVSGECLLTQGGDSRLKNDRVSGLSGYGCSPKPRPWAVTFASSTATSISDYAFNEVEMVRQRLMEAVCLDNITKQYDAEVEGIRSGILEAFDLKDIAGAEVVLTTSGTDAELLASFLAGCANKAPLTNILVGPEETGSGIPLAASGRHFAADTPLCNKIRKGELVEGLPDGGIHLVTVPLRNCNGTFLSLDTVDNRVNTLASKAVAAGNRVLVHIVESSKTGLSAPSMTAVSDLKNRYGPLLDVLVDACQLRICIKRLKQYLEAGFMISVTGSKFYTGPAFSGALILPPDIARRLRDSGALPPGLNYYFTSYEIPERMHPATTATGQYRNIGLLLRWKAALWEIAAFRAVSDKHKYLIFALFGESVRESISANPDLELVSSPALERWKLPDGEEWDWLPTIFTFTMSRPGPRGIRSPIYLDDAIKIYHWLNTDISESLPQEASEHEKILAGKRCHIGQPVKIAANSDRWIAALRISAGARLISGVCFDPALGRHFAERLSKEIGDACSALDKISIIIKYLDYIESHSKHSEPDDDYNDAKCPYLI